jgi:Na+/melibiose symporter-like transporter
MSIPITGAMLPISIYLAPIYAQQFHMSLYALGAIFLAERIWGTFSDPIVGWLCDRTSSRFGRRKIWIAAGSVLFALTYFYLFFPLGQVSPVAMAVALALMFFAWSMIVIPYYAWSGELTEDYHERTRVTAYQTVIGSVMLVAVLVLPAIIERYYPGHLLLKLNVMGAAILIPMIPGTILTLWAFPDSKAAPPAVKRKKTDWRQTLRAVAGETVILRIMLADFAILVAQSIRGGLFIFYASFVVGLPQWGAALYLFQFAFGMFAPPIWQAIARRIGKTAAVYLGEVAQAAINFALLLVGPGDIALLLFLTFLQGLTQGTGNLLLRAMLADVADEHRLRTGTDRTAMLFSVFSISGKAGSAIPLGLALPFVAWFGFDPGAASQPAGGLLALGLMFALGPALAHAVAALLVRGLTMDEARLSAIQGQLHEIEGGKDEPEARPAH